MESRLLGGSVVDLLASADRLVHAAFRGATARTARIAFLILRARCEAFLHVAARHRLQACGTLFDEGERLRIGGLAFHPLQDAAQLRPVEVQLLALAL